MSWQNFMQVAVLAILLLVTVPPMGRYFADVYGHRKDGSARTYVVHASNAISYKNRQYVCPGVVG